MQPIALRSCLGGAAVLALLQTGTNSLWTASRVESLVVMVNVGDECSGAGFLTGFDGSRVYAVTAAHVLAGISQTSPAVSVRIPVGWGRVCEETVSAALIQRDMTRAVDLVVLTQDPRRAAANGEGQRTFRGAR